MTALKLCQEAARLGLRLEPRGDKLAVIPAGRVPPDFADELRRHKGELLDFLESKAANVTADCIPWLHVARQVLAGEFDGADASTVASLTIGLRTINVAVCREALIRLQATGKTGRA